MHEASVRDVGPAFRRHFSDLRSGLLRLHKALLDAEQISYERIHGRVDSPGTLLHLVMKDPWFTWLLPLSKLVVRIDEMLDEQDPSSDAARTILTQVQTLLKPSEQGEGFERNYYEALQRAPDVVLAHADVKKLLAAASR